MKSMHLVALGDGNGRYATVDTANGNVVRFSPPGSWTGYALMMTQEGAPGRYSFKAYGETPPFGVTEDGTVCAVRHQVFIADPPEGPRMTLRTESGDALVIEGGGELAVENPGNDEPAVLEVRVLQRYEGAVHGMEDCCGNHHGHEHAAGEGDGDLAWNDVGHQTIVRWARDILEAHRGSVDGAALVCDCMASATFWKGVTTGLKDADDLDPRYAGILYSSHFYDPDTGCNYLGWPTGTALTEADRRFREAAALAIGGGATYDAGFALGLALHYLTDLTQPMHAANFIQFGNGPFDTRHSQFEGFLDRELARAPAEYRLEPSSVVPGEAFSEAGLRASTTELVKSVARYSKDVFKQRLRPLLATVPATFVEGDHGIPYPSYDPAWVRETRGFLPEIVRNAQLQTARFLVRWGRAINPTNLKNFANAKMREGDTGAWTFSATGADGTWRRGDHNGHSARVNVFTRSQLSISGEFCSTWWGGGEVIPFRLDVWYDTETNRWRMYCRDGSREIHCELHSPRVSGSTLSFERVLPPGVVAESALAITPLQTSASWYGGVQLRVSAEGVNRHACFEDKTHY